MPTEIARNVHNTNQLQIFRTYKQYSDFRCRQTSTEIFVKIQTSNGKQMRTALFWAVILRVVVSPYRRLGTAYRSLNVGKKITLLAV